MWRSLSLCLVLILSSVCTAVAQAEPLTLRLRQQSEVASGTERYHRTETTESWDPANTAIIVCDMWDSHHCYRAVQRVKEIAPRMNELLVKARQQGVTIIHAPSDCMAAYEEHPARKRALTTPAASTYPDNIGDWCYSIDAEDPEKYPIDQSDGGEDDTPAEHARWESELKAAGRNPKAPWLRQYDVLKIDADRDYITDRGKEVWNILQTHQIDNVILVGVHTNMCVLGRPFGLRRLSQAGKHVVLCRDMTDTMYNPASWPYVSHYSGTDLIINHIERHVCPTITSDQLLGGEPFRFQADKRPRLAVVINEPEYETERTLPLFAREHLWRDYQVNLIYGDATDPNSFPGIQLLGENDILVLSARRRTPPLEQLDAVRRFVASGKPVIGIRTANHAFHLRNQPAPDGAADWPTLDADVFGGNYTNHYGPNLVTTVTPVAQRRGHLLLNEIPAEPFIAGGSLYMVSPISERTEIVLMGAVDGHQPEPVAWTYRRLDGGKSFYTSLGTPADFDHPTFKQLLLNAIAWAAE